MAVGGFKRRDEFAQHRMIFAFRREEHPLAHQIGEHTDILMALAHAPLIDPDATPWLKSASAEAASTCRKSIRHHRMVGSTRNVSRVCNERFSWVNGGGKLWRAKLGVLAGLLNIRSLDEYAEQFGPKWAYHLQPVLTSIVLPYYDDMKLAKMDGWDLTNERGEPWPWPDLSPPAEAVQRSHWVAFIHAKEILLRRSGRHRDQKCPSETRPEAGRAELSKPPRPAFKSWLDYTAAEN